MTETTNDVPAADGPSAQATFLPGTRESDLRVTPTELASWLKLSKQTVHQHKVTGRIRFDSDGRAPLARARADYQRNVDHAKAPRRAGAVPADVIELRDQNQRLHADNVRMQAALAETASDDDGGNGPGLNETRSALLKVRLAREVFQQERELGLWLSKAQVVDGLTSAIVVASGALQELPRRVAEHASLPTGAETEALIAQIDICVHAVLHQLARAFGEMGKPT